MFMNKDDNFQSLFSEVIVIVQERGEPSPVLDQPSARLALNPQFAGGNGQYIFNLITVTDLVFYNFRTLY